MVSFPRSEHNAVSIKRVPLEVSLHQVEWYVREVLSCEGDKVGAQIFIWYAEVIDRDSWRHESPHGSHQGYVKGRYVSRLSL